jgi:hypothetical protein
VAGLGHEDQFRPPSLSGGCRLGKATFAGVGGKEKDAPIAAIDVIGIELAGCLTQIGTARPSGERAAGWASG